MYKQTALLGMIVLVHLCYSAPYNNEMKRFAKSETKKDIFISRGWGAGGMPFSVLYMNPNFSSSKAPLTVENNVKTQHKGLPQVRTAMRQKNLNRSPHSVIPQLFVSYGWGPLG